MTQATTMISRNDATALIDRWATQAGPVLTITMPLRPAGPEAEQNAIRRKNALRAAEAALETLEPAEADSLRERLALLRDADLEAIAPRTQGAIWLISPGEATSVWTPHALVSSVELAAVARLQVLMPFLGGPGRFHLLALSENVVKFFRGDANGLEEIELEEVGASLEEERWMDDFENALQWHASSRGSGDVIHHGHGGGKEHEEIRRRQFFQAVARAVHLWRRRHEPEAAFGIAAVERTAAGFEEAYADAPASDFLLAGSPDHLDEADLHQAALEALEESGDDRGWKEQLGQAGAEDRLSTDPLEIIRHAAAGRVATLVIQRGAHLPAERTGSHADGTPAWARAAEADGKTSDLVSACIASVTEHGGSLVGIGVDDDEPMLRAVLRY